MITESDIIPFSHSLPPGNAVAVLAPHPDDETLGVGGSLTRLAESGKKPVVFFLTSGDKADPSHPLVKRHGGNAHLSAYAAMREAEAQRALKILGIKEWHFLRFPDRCVHDFFAPCLEALESAMVNETLSEGKFKFDTIYAPSPIELNPDHRAAAALALRLGQRLRLDVAFYEVTVPLRPNLLVDITAAGKKKNKAIRAYKSQLKLLAYDEYINSLNRLRALTLPGKTSTAEAFMVFRAGTDLDSVMNWVSYGECFRELM